MNRARLANILFLAAAAAVAIAHIVIAFDSLLDKRLWEDEAFNLTVPRNLLDGLGYSSDGTLSGSTLTPWDVRISTGPTVLLPITAVLALGADPVFGGRGVALAFWALLLAGLFVLGRRLGGRWGGLVAVAAALALDAGRSHSPIQGPADILGEIPAAALIVWALVVLPRRAWLAGLLLGLAIQAKLIALLALPAFFVWLVVASPGRPAQRVVAAFRRGWPALLTMAVPTALYEVGVMLDPRKGYTHHLTELKDFVLSGGQVHQGTTVDDKVRTLLESWWLPPAAVAALVFAGLAVAILALWVRSHSDPTTERPAPEIEADRAALAVAAAVGLLAFVGWWAQSSHTPLWVRHPAPGLYAFTPVLVAGIVPVVRTLLHGRARVVRVVGMATAAVLALALGGQALLHAQSAAVPENALATQRADAAAIAHALEESDVPLEGGYLVAEPWGSTVSIVFLTGHRVGLWDAPGRANDPRVTAFECEPALHVGERYRLCDPD